MKKIHKLGFTLLPVALTVPLVSAGWSKIKINQKLVP